jgi:hypothetical protein
MSFDWHGAVITRETVVDSTYRNTQNVRRFLLLACGPTFKFDRELMAWIREGHPQKMGDIVDQWKRAHP